MKKKEIIPVVFSVDDKYMIPLLTALTSLLSNKGNATVYHIYVLYAGKLSEKNRDRLLDKRWSEEGDTLEPVKIEDSLFREVFIHTYISVSAYYRLLIPELFGQLDKCIYLDCDLLVLDDLQEFYHTDLRGYYLAGVPDCGVRVNEKSYRRYAEETGLPDIHNYINSGVLLMNLSAIRRDNLKEEMYRLALNSYQMADQDVLNIACYGKIRIIPLKYNVFKSCYQDTLWLKDAGFTQVECREAEEKPVILHFAEELKPWNNRKIKGAGLWYRYAGRALTEPEYEGMMEEARRRTRLLDQYYLPERLEGKNIVIFGFTQYGSEALRFLEKQRAGHIAGFCDNNEAKQGQSFKEYRVYSLQEVQDRYDKLFFIIASQSRYEEIGAQLKAAGISASDMARYRRTGKGTPYYEALDPVYYREETDRIMELETGEEGWSQRIPDMKKELEKEKYKELAKAYRMERWILKKRREQEEKDGI